ncbi:hypothetical protein NIES2111_33130 [Nostoc sp. NIES-2111]|jgi:hypothetical protein|nr:hypothetical protein NIES2111_33130 [Nostoc sp. NIES-2111]
MWFSCGDAKALAQPLSTTRSANVENGYAHQPGEGEELITMDY